MKRALRRWGSAAALALALGGGSWGQTPPVTEPTGLVLGFPSTSRARLPLEDFQALNPNAGLTELPWSRNIVKPIDTPLPLKRADLPPLLVVNAGSFAEDIRQLAERRLIEPVDETLAALGIKREDFPPETLAAFSYRGTLYAIPQHVTVPVLRYWREPFGTNAPAAPGSWEELLALGKPLLPERGAPGPKRVLTIAMSTARFAEMVAMACGEPPLDVAKPSFLTSTNFENALRWVLENKANGLITYRKTSTPMRPAFADIFGIDQVDSVNVESPFGMLPFPTRLRAGDAAPTRSYVRGRAEGIALRSLSPQFDARRMDFLRWLFSPENEWRMFERTNARTLSERWVLDNTHVPLRATTMQSLDFEYALKKFPDLAVLREQNARAVFTQIPAPLEDLVWERVEAKMDYLPKDVDLHALLQQLAQEAEDLVRNAAVSTAAYAEY